MAEVGKQIKEGRHVGLDFYDLLIEALMGRTPHHGVLDTTAGDR
jgi:hypothetical protein